MAVKTGDFVLYFGDQLSGNEVCIKCKGAKKSGDFVVEALDSDDNLCAVSVLPAHYQNTIGFKVRAAFSDAFATLSGSGKSFIAMSWIDESDDYTDNYNDIYYDHVDLFKDITDRATKYVCSCDAPCRGNDCVNDLVYNYDFPYNYGIDISMSDIPRGPDLPSNYLINSFENLLSDFQNKEPTHINYPDVIILIVDDSGSMRPEDIGANGAYNQSYDNLVNHILVYHGYSIGNNFFTRTYSNEEWLRIWAEELYGLI